MSARSGEVASTSIPLQTLGEPRQNTSMETSRTLNDSPDTNSNFEQHNDDNGTSRNDSANINSPKQVDESVDTSVFPPLPSHYYFLTTQFYRLLSFFLSLAFLIVVVTLAMFKTFPSIGWVILSRVQFKDPNRFRPFYKQEKERKRKPQGKLKCDVGYYAQREGLSCQEFKVETEDGFILTIQHIFDSQPGAVDPKRSPPPRNDTLTSRKVSRSVVARINAIIGSVLRQR